MQQTVHLPQVNFNDLQTFVVQLNANILLYENNLNALYHMLLLDKPSPWENTLLAMGNKDYMEQLVQRQIEDIKGNLRKQLKNSLRKEKMCDCPLIRILKAKKKSVFVEEIDIQSPNWECDNRGLDGNVMELLESIAAVCTNRGRVALKLLEDSPQLKYAVYRIGTRYSFTFIDQDPVPQQSSQFFSKIPKQMITHHILPMLNIKELMRCRRVSKSWKQYVKMTWPQSLLKEVTTKLMLGSFCSDVEFVCQLMRIRGLISGKISFFMEAVLELIDWAQLSCIVLTDQIRPALKSAILVLLRVTGQTNIEPVLDIPQQTWKILKHQSINLGPIIKTFVSSNTFLLSTSQLNKIKSQVLDHPLMHMSQLQTDEKTQILTFLLSKLLTLQLLLRQSVLLSHQYITYSKTHMLQIAQSRVDPKYLQSADKIMRGRLQPVGFFSMRSFLKSLEYSKEEFAKPDFRLVEKENSLAVYISNAVKVGYFVTIKWDTLDFGRLLRDRLYDPPLALE